MSATTAATTVASLPTAFTHETRLAPSSTQPLDPLDAYFGYTFSASASSSSATGRTHESRHDRDSTFVEPLPEYTAEDASLPEYTVHAPEPVTLAMYLFKFGFLFPPFWIFGAFILFSDLHEPAIYTPTEPSSTSSSSTSPSSASSSWMPEKTEDEKRAIIATLRATELKWAKRCLVALVIFIALVLAGVLAAWALLKRQA